MRGGGDEPNIHMCAVIVAGGGDTQRIESYHPPLICPCFRLRYLNTKCLMYLELKNKIEKSENVCINT